MQKLWFFVFLHMFKKGVLLFCLFLAFATLAQEVRVPVDLRQHNLTEFNSSFFNPVLSFYRNNPQSVALWTRWQWQQVDADPSTLFLNYTRALNDESTAAIGFFQHNTGIFVNTGGLLNYAYIYNINDDLAIGVGLNLFGFKQMAADTRFMLDPDFPLPQITTNDFIVQAAPGLLVKWNDLQLGISSENLFDYNFTRKKRQSNPKERIYMVSGGYDFHLFSGKSVLKPVLYWKTLPFQDDQLGLTTLFSTDKYWAQVGYNSFYGASVAAGGRFFKKVSIGALMEFATDASLEGIGSTFEIILAYQFGKQEANKPEKPEVEELIVETEDAKKEDEEMTEVVENEKKAKAEERRQQKEQRQQEKDAALEAKKAEKLTLKTKDAEKKEATAQKAAVDKKQHDAEKLAEQQRIASSKKAELDRKDTLQQQKMDSLAHNAKRMQRKAAAAAAQKRLDSINGLREQKETVNTTLPKEEVVVQKNERYEEVKTEDGLQPGFYLIANVFRTKTYYTAFMENLDKKGLQPKSFLRSLNNYQYVYLMRYDTMAEARKARNSKFFGKYSDKTWIFRIVGE